ncbi:helix-turn-helix domain-containing protein [Pediococcus pentosaceus]|uniref:helix-turn-helix domain-containing protein n=1 Tax=Pediococcus pentosaceus TaxID=1255 RepID=UPI0018A19D58|nr:helix-turn-helix transcriptional regulator [Pediococcus pentosaceus]MBF7129040.1 helix-turn-helix transcriptional regulator [Pediococcus pentosaceus]MBF7131833.1 helix-turn-helix transcriptional regulator [Pediococcus pentosaceus]
MTLFDKIKKISKERGYSIAEVERKAGISTNYLYQWKKREPSPKSLASVAKVLGVSVDYLLGKDDKPSTSNEPVDLDKALSEEGIAMFDGKPLSEEYKKALLAMLRANKNSGE